MGSGGLLELLMPQAPAELRATMSPPTVGATPFDEVLTQAIGLAGEPPANEPPQAGVLSLNDALTATTHDASVVDTAAPLDPGTGNPLPVIDVVDGVIMPLGAVDEGLSKPADADSDPVVRPIEIQTTLDEALTEASLIPLPSLSSAPLPPGDAPTSRTSSTTPSLLQQPPIDSAVARSTVSSGAADGLLVDEQHVVGAHTERAQESSTAATTSGNSKPASVLDAAALQVPTVFPGRPAPASPERPTEPMTVNPAAGLDRPTDQASRVVRPQPEPVVVVPMPVATPPQRVLEPGKSNVERATPMTVRIASANESTAVRAEALSVPVPVAPLVLPEAIVDARAVRTMARHSTAEATVGSEATSDVRPAHAALPRELRELGAAMAPAPDLARRQGELMTQTLAERVVMLRAAGQSAATVSLEPESLGRVDVHVRVDADKTHINFTAQHSAVRDVIEANLPRLRLMLEDAGLSLGNVNVGHSDAGAGRDRFASPDWRRPDDPTRALANDSDSAHSRVINDRLIDVHV